MNSPAHDIALYLVANAVGTLPWTSGWAVSVALEPPEPNNSVTVYDTGGQEPDTDELDLMRPSLQVRVRSVSYQDAYDKQVQIRDLLILPQPISAEDSDFVSIQMTSDILSIGRDDNNRHVLVANYLAIRTERS